MINRKILYGYRIRNGILEIVPEEQQTVKRIFTLYNAGASYQGISDALNQGNIPYSQEVPLWNKHKVKRLLENPRYTGQDDYPAIVDMEVFRAGRQRTAEKNEKRRPLCVCQFKHSVCPPSFVSGVAAYGSSFRMPRWAVAPVHPPGSRSAPATGIGRRSHTTPTSVCGRYLYRAKRQVYSSGSASCASFRSSS